MIANQHLASSMADAHRSGSAGRAKLELLSIYSNMKANELVAPQTERVQGKLTTFNRNRGQIDAKAPLEAPFEVFAEQVRDSVFDHITDHGLSFGSSKIRYCTVCKRYIYSSFNSMEVL
jgi:hypothetical protein